MSASLVEKELTIITTPSSEAEKNDGNLPASSIGNDRAVWRTEKELNNKNEAVEKFRS